MLTTEVLCEQRCLPFDQKFRLEFPEISSAELSSLFQNSRKQYNVAKYTKLSKIYYCTVLFHLMLLPEFPLFMVKWFGLLKLTNCE